MKLITLTQNQLAQVDDEDYDYLMQWKWHAQWIKNSFYAFRGLRLPKISKGIYGKIIRIAMHRVIMKTPNELVVDHNDHNGLNNQKYNLRNCTQSDNLKNRNKSKTNNKFKGVSKVGDIYKASIMSNGKIIKIGVFYSEIEAALAYNKAAKKYHGEFACINNIY